MFSVVCESSSEWIKKYHDGNKVGINVLADVQLHPMACLSKYQSGHFNIFCTCTFKH
jgi:hypothetical protein